MGQLNGKKSRTAEPQVEVDDHVHEYILSNVSPEIEKKHRAKAKDRAIARGTPPDVAELLYGDTK